MKVMQQDVSYPSQRSKFLVIAERKLNGEIFLGGPFVKDPCYSFKTFLKEINSSNKVIRTHTLFCTQAVFNSYNSTYNQKWF